MQHLNKCNSGENIVLGVLTMSGNEMRQYRKMYWVIWKHKNEREQ